MSLTLYFSLLLVGAGLVSGYLVGGQAFGLFCTAVAVVLLVLARQKRPAPDMDAVTPSKGLWDAPSSSAMIQFIRDSYKRQRGQ
jgi:hypothetical protein